MPTEEELEQLVTEHIKRNQEETKQAIDCICKQLKSKESKGGGKN